MKDQLPIYKNNARKKSQEISACWGSLVEKVDEVIRVLRKSDISVDRFSVDWMSFYQVIIKNGLFELAAFGGE
jgi:hypothetical protein